MTSVQSRLMTGTFLVAIATAALFCFAPSGVSARQAAKIGKTFRDLADAPEMVVVPPGRFTMGSPATEEGRGPSEGPVHRVTVAKPFALGKYEVTKAQFAAFVAATGYVPHGDCGGTGASWRNPGLAQGDDHPAVCISALDAGAYADWLSVRTGQHYRLPSEAEFDYAARGKISGATNLLYWFGNAAADMCVNANGADQTDPKASIDGTVAPCRDGYVYTAPVGRFAANGFGLYDMAGNVWQWTADCENRDYANAPTDGSADRSGVCQSGVLRGGSWRDSPRFLRAASRMGVGWFWGTNEYGFRVARDM